MSNPNYVISENVGKNTHHLPVMVVMVPLPLQGHLNQLLHLSRLLSAFNIPVHFVSTATHNRQAQYRISAKIKNHLIQFHDFDLPIFPSPNPNATHKFPSHLVPMVNEVLVHFPRPFAAFLSSLSQKAKRLIVIHDSLMSSVVQVVDSIVNVESYIFHSVSAFVTTLHYLERKGIVVGDGDDDEEECESRTFYREYVLKELNTVSSWERWFSVEFWDLIKSQFGQLPKKTCGQIYNTCRVIEGSSLKLIERIESKFNNWALGPFNPVKKLKVLHTFH